MEFWIIRVNRFGWDSCITLSLLGSFSCLCFLRSLVFQGPLRPTMGQKRKQACRKILEKRQHKPGFAHHTLFASLRYGSFALVVPLPIFHHHPSLYIWMSQGRYCRFCRISLFGLWGDAIGSALVFNTIVECCVTIQRERSRKWKITSEKNSLFWRCMFTPEN